MKLSILRMTAFKSSMLATGCVIAFAAFAANADDSSASTTSAPDQQRHAHSHHGHHPGSAMHDPFLRAIHRLNLTADQEQRIHALFASAHQQQHEQRHQQMHPDVGVLANPGDPAYPAAIQKAKTDAADRIQAHSDLDSQVYALLTNDQQAKLPQVIADMKTHRPHHRQKFAPPAAS